MLLKIHNPTLMIPWYLLAFASALPAKAQMSVWGAIPISEARQKAPAGTPLTRYVYCENDRPADAQGYPKAKDVLKGVNLKSGLALEMPAKSVVFLTTVGVMREP
jgi:hypothetical protein